MTRSTRFDARGGFPVVTTDDGASWTILPSHARMRWTEADASAAVAEAFEDPANREAILELAESLGARAGDEADALGTLARAIADGSLLAFIEPTRPTGRPITRSNPVIPPPVRPTPDVTPAWVSFELLDHEGTPLGDHEISFEHEDGRLDSVRLDALGRSPRLTTTAGGSIHLEWPSQPNARLQAAAHTPRIDGFRARPDDLRIARRPVGTTRLGPNRHWRIIVDPPPPPVIGVTAAAFGVDSSFPTPAILVPLLGVAFADVFSELVGDAVDSLASSPRIIQVFGHAGADGEVARNKALSDRRADVFAALLVGDVDAVQEIARAEGWGTREHQAMLRVLRCDPGAIDGEFGELTANAVRSFQSEYRDGVFHRHCADQLAPRSASLGVTGELDPSTIDALIEALVVATSPRVPASRMHPTHPTTGCSEFNRRSGQPTPRDRRLTIIAHDSLPTWDEPPPCKRGDHSACAIDGTNPMTQCKWYREHVAEAPDEPLHRHFDLRWLVLPSGRILLSALTTIPDDGEVSFEAFWTAPLASLEELDESSLVEPIFGPKVGLVRSGVAQLVWEPPPGVNLFDREAWLVAVPGRRPADLWAAEQRSRFPVFRVTGGGATTISPPPGDDLARLASERVTRDTGEQLDDVQALDAFGRILGASLVDGRVGAGRHSLAPDEPRIVAVRLAAGDVPQDEEVSS